MKLCDFQTGIGRMQRETKELRDQWQEVRKHWDDQVARDFEKKYLDPLIPNLKLTLAAVYEMAETTEEAEQRLGDTPPTRRRR